MINALDSFFDRPKNKKIKISSNKFQTGLFQVQQI